MLNASYFLVLVSSTNLIGEKKQFVTSMRATEKKLENQVSLEGIAVLMRPYWPKQLSLQVSNFVFIAEYIQLSVHKYNHDLRG